LNPFAELQTAIVDAFPGLSPEMLPVSTPPDFKLGDVAIPFFQAAKALGAPPPKLAAEAAEKVDFGAAVVSAAPAGPYLNLRLDRGRFVRGIVSRVKASGPRWG